MQYLTAFLTGGAICVLGQLLIDKTNLTPARILTGFVVAGVILGALGLYQPLTLWPGGRGGADFGLRKPDGAGRARRAARGRRAWHSHRRGEKRGGRHCGGNRFSFSLCAALFSKSRDK